MIAVSLVVGLCCTLLVLVLGAMGWLLLGWWTHVWVDGCPDVAPPLAPLAWRLLHAWVVAPAWALVALSTGWRVGLHQLSCRDGTPPPPSAPLPG
jgi:hypothetical protein